MNLNIIVGNKTDNLEDWRLLQLTHLDSVNPWSSNCVSLLSQQLRALNEGRKVYKQMLSTPYLEHRSSVEAN
jgi:hypothetical protein